MKKIILTTGLMTAILLSASVLTAGANPSALVSPTSSASATSSITYLTKGNSTFLIIDSYTSGIPRLYDQATVFVQAKASSSVSTITATVSYSQNGYDWYNDNVNVSTTTAVQNLTTPNSYSLSGNTTSSTTLSAFVIKLPVRYAKITYTASVGTTSLWSTILPQMQQQ